MKTIAWSNIVNETGRAKTHQFRVYFLFNLNGTHQHTIEEEKKSSTAQRANNKHKIAYYRIWVFRDLPLGLRALLLLYFFLFQSSSSSSVTYAMHTLLVFPLHSIFFFSTRVSLLPRIWCCTVWFNIYRLLFTYYVSLFGSR